MAAPVQPPPIVMESRDPHSIRFTPTEWSALRTAAAQRGVEPAVFVRQLAMYALSIVPAPVLSEASLGVLAVREGPAREVLRRIFYPCGCPVGPRTAAPVHLPSCADHEPARCAACRGVTLC